MIVEMRGVSWSVRERHRVFGKVRHKHVLRDADLSVAPGEVVGLAGPSGAGKTTLGMCLLRLIRPRGGAVFWDGVDVTSWSESTLLSRRQRYQVLLQAPYAMLTPFLTVRQHLEETLRYVVGRTRPGVRDWADLVEELALETILDSMPTQLSGGEARRVGLARVLLCRPVFLFADEPDAGLDPPRRMALAARLRNLAHDGSGLLVVTHDAPTLNRVSDRLVTLHEGRVQGGCA